MDAKSNDDTPFAVDENDRNAARQALARNWPDLDPTCPKYTAMIETLAESHHLSGAENFELRYNLRPPRDRTERWTQQFMHEEITEAEFRARLKADAERPIDLEMLTAVHDAFQSQLSHYSGVLQKAVLKPSEAGTATWREKGQAIDEHIAALRGKLPLWRENLETVFEFLEELRITSGAGLLKAGEFEATSAHWLAQLIFTRLMEAWRSCTEVSERSHHNPRYLYAARAIDLFQHSWLPIFPPPQNISERLREEFILAHAALRQATSASPDATSHSPAGAFGAEQAIDNESHELVLIGDMFSIVGQAGHIFRLVPNSDWGIDGEIEFKDDAMLASGGRLYVQLKSGDSHLVRRRDDGEEVFTVKKLRHLEYWKQQAYPVMLVIRQSSGLIRWMNVSDYLRQHASLSSSDHFSGRAGYNRQCFEHWPSSVYKGNDYPATA